MRRIALIAVGITLAGYAAGDDALLQNTFLQKIIREYKLRPLPTKPFEETAKYKLGRALFFDPVLSGNRDISCATCHLLHLGTSDGLPFAVGTGGRGVGPSRTPAGEGPLQPRNALDLWNRDNNWVRSMFWDGSIELLDPERQVFRSPMGGLLPSGFDNLMAVQAVFPLAREDEMLGQAGDRSSASLPELHADQINELASLTSSLKGPERIGAVLRLVMKRLVGEGNRELQPWQAEYRSLFAAAYPENVRREWQIVHAANAISHFEEIAFATRNAPWDAYLRGESTAIGVEEKRGAFIFFGKARCAACHAGPLFSDFEFHAIGVRNFGPGIDGSGDDEGRYRATGDPRHRYEFRTPPLRNVTLTAPYFHNGSTPTLRAAISQHLDALYYADKYTESGAYELSVDQIRAISPVLVDGIMLTHQEIDQIISFLGALEDRSLDYIEKIIPSSVPSGLDVVSLNSD